MLRVINLEDGLPTVEQAVKRLNLEVMLARKQKIRVLKIIHGYGSTGKGGKIRVACRRELESMQRRGLVKFFVIGESLSIFDENTRKITALSPEFRKDSDIDRFNSGVTVAVL
jgi:hypothetical protein